MQVKGTEWKFELIFKSTEKRLQEKKIKIVKRKQKVCGPKKSIFD